MDDTVLVGWTIAAVPIGWALGLVLYALTYGRGESRERRAVPKLIEVTPYGTIELVNVTDAEVARWIAARGGGSTARAGSVHRDVGSPTGPDQRCPTGQRSDLRKQA